MKLAILADIHGNYPALQTVLADIEQWRPEAVVVAGDIVNRGPRSSDCLKLIQHKQQTDGWQLVRGNHEDYVIKFAAPHPVFSNAEFEVYRCSYWTYLQLQGDVSALEAMPAGVTIPSPPGNALPKGNDARIVHASMRGNRDGIFSRTSDEQLREKIFLPNQPAPALLGVGHTHVPLIRSIDGTLVVNVGAVGLPFDGDHRATYGRLTWQQGQWSAQIVRLAYDRPQAEQDFFDTGFITEAGPLARIILNELRTAHSRLYSWTADYERAVVAGKITLAASVDLFLAQCE